MDCIHEQFKCVCEVTRIQEEGEPVSAYRADLKICCLHCGVSFGFIGLPTGLRDSMPTTSLDRTELRLPIEPTMFIEPMMDKIKGQSIQDN